MHISTRTAVVAAAVATTVGMGAGPALASDSTDVTLAAGSLGITNPTVAEFGSVSLTGAAQTRTASIDGFTVTDGTGSGNGWNVTVQATPFAEWDGNGYVVSGRTLPTGSLSQTAPTVSSPNTDSADPAITSGPYTIDSGSAVKIASAAAGTGMGEYQFGATTLTLSVPASAYATTYRSEVTVSVVTGP